MFKRLTFCLCALSAVLVAAPSAHGEVTAEDVLRAIERGKRFLVSQQQGNGSWSVGGGQYRTGITSLSLMALVNSGVPLQDPAIQRGLTFLRGTQEPTATYEVALMIMALTAARDGRRDSGRILRLVNRLEEGQLTAGVNKGCWTYDTSKRGVFRGNLSGDRSNGQFAVLALRDAQEYGIPVDRKTWRMARDHWGRGQNGDGGWGYSGIGGQDSSYGSMTVAGIATMVITNAMLQEEDELDADGNPICCGKPEQDKYIESLERGVAWLGRNLAVGHNPRKNTWLLYYLYGLERAGRLSARRFFGKHDWYREGAELLIRMQNGQSGSWEGDGIVENHPVGGTSFALLFLSKGLAPVLINKLKFGPRDGRGFVTSNNWNHHRSDVNNLTQLISGLPRWPKLLTWQVVDSQAATVTDFNQARVLFMSGRDSHDFSDGEITTLTEYVAEGGTIFAEACCRGKDFDASFRRLVKQMYPQGDPVLRRLPPDHEIFRAEFPLDPETVELWGVDFGCRTAIVFSPHDLSCLWDKWRKYDPSRRPPQLKQMIDKATKIGVNVIAYATGREPPIKSLDESAPGAGKTQETIRRGFFEIAKLRHAGSWNAAPRAVRNLLIALNETVGMAASTKVRTLTAVDPAIFQFPMVYMHGRHKFGLSRQEQQNLRKYLERGGMLFADSCCGSRNFDQSFRQMMAEMFPETKLKRIPNTHEMFSGKFGRDIRKVKRRAPEAADADVLKTNVRVVEPYLEGIEINGRYVVIYSKFDISCALERQTSVACAGYLHEDAVKIAVNVVLYSMLGNPRPQAAAP